MRCISPAVTVGKYSATNIDFRRIIFAGALLQDVMFPLALFLQAGVLGVHPEAGIGDLLPAEEELEVS